MSLSINKLETRVLRSPLSVIVEPDNGCFLAKNPDLPRLYGVGEDQHEAIAMLQREIESLWEDLQEEGQLNSEWESVRDLLNRLVIS